VLTGVSHPADVLLAPPGLRPSYLAAGLAGLLSPHPGVTEEGGGYRCGRWTARWVDGQLELTGSGDRIDGLRALAAAAWAAPSVSPDAVAPALDKLALN
jgi:glycerol-1-phosphatase